MATSINRVPVGPEEYANVSNGNLNCTVFVPNGAALRCIVAGEAPALDAPDFIPFKSGANNGSFSINNLEAEDDLFVLSDKPMELMVMRGPAVLTFR